MAKAQGIVVGQRVDPAKRELAKQLRSAMTPQEWRLWARVRANRLQGLHFRRQHIIEGFIVDFYCHKAGLVVEIDGPIHEHQVSYDAERARRLAARGLRIIRFSNEEIDTKLDEVVRLIGSVCREQLEA